MILWCQRLLTCIRQTGTNMKLPLGAGPRSMPWAKQALVCEGREPFFFLYFSYVSTFVVSTILKWTKEGFITFLSERWKKHKHMLMSCCCMDNLIFSTMKCVCINLVSPNPSEDCIAIIVSCFHFLLGEHFPGFVFHLQVLWSFQWFLIKYGTLWD